MIDRKDFVIMVLAGFILTVTLYPAITASVGEYDPWLDVNDDGKIRIDDILSTALAFGSDGDPTKNVIIAGYNWSQSSYTFWLQPGEEGNLTVTTAGYKQITLGFKASPYMSPPSPKNVTVATGFLMGATEGIVGYHVYLDRFNVTMGWTGPDTPILHEYPMVRTYDVRGLLLTVAYYNPNDVTMELLIEYYMTA